ncbi:fumarylacetoacetate hydrolase family protein [Actinomycetospora atypica]|uniref:Fumarylacetoacetate hydrolase family protein n=1 Tax=Actinomycetospora atypica TaxID=1290095 RepID=A0ABV9YM40_9PSEU
MRIARFAGPDGAVGFGPVEGEQVVDVSARLTWPELLADPAAARSGDPRHAVADVAWAPPVEEGAKVVCVGFNFAAHAAETGREVPVRPTLFTRFPDSFVGSGGAVVRPPESEQLDWEGEVALVVGTVGRRIAEADALGHVAGWTCMAENSVRDWQLHSGQAVAGKNWEASGVLGPWVVTADEFGDRPLAVTTRLNGDVVQHDTTDHLTFSAAALIAYISTFTTLRPGDVVALGTPSGIGFRREPPRFLAPGDRIEVEVDRVGVLRHTVVDDLVPAALGAP